MDQSVIGASSSKRSLNVIKTGITAVKIYVAPKSLVDGLEQDPLYEFDPDSIKNFDRNHLLYQGDVRQQQFMFPSNPKTGYPWILRTRKPVGLPMRTIKNNQIAPEVKAAAFFDKEMERRSLGNVRRVPLASDFGYVGRSKVNIIPMDGVKDSIQRNYIHKSITDLSELKVQFEIEFNSPCYKTGLSPAFSKDIALDQRLYDAVLPYKKEVVNREKAEQRKEDEAAGRLDRKKKKSNSLHRATVLSDPMANM